MTRSRRTLLVLALAARGEGTLPPTRTPVRRSTPVPARPATSNATARPPAAAASPSSRTAVRPALDRRRPVVPAAGESPVRARVQASRPPVWVWVREPWRQGRGGSDVTFDSRAVPQRPYPALSISLARTSVRLQMSAFVDSEDCLSTRRRVTSGPTPPGPDPSRKTRGLRVASPGPSPRQRGGGGGGARSLGGSTRVEPRIARLHAVGRSFSLAVLRAARWARVLACVMRRTQSSASPGVGRCGLRRSVNSWTRVTMLPASAGATCQ
jgi:hypothetical protein